MDQDQEPVCRICRCEEEEGRPLFHPCKCSGSIKFVHNDCLEAWLKDVEKGKVRGEGNADTDLPCAFWLTLVPPQISEIQA